VRKIVLVVLAVVSVLLIGVFSWYLYISKDARRRDSAQFAIAFRKDLGQCTVSQRDFSHGHALACGSVEAYIRDQLKLPPGTRFVIFDMGDSHRTEIDLLASTLQQRGYRLVGRLSATISEPGSDR
jgi:hypothetical protein